MPTLLFIVSRRLPELHAHVSQQFAGEPDMQVMLDRRIGERRRHTGSGAPGPERRRSERRRNTETAYQLLTMGYAFARVTRAS
jgi:hypothetical protein